MHILNHILLGILFLNSACATEQPSTSFTAAHAKLTLHVSQRAPLLLLNNDEDYVSDLLTHHGHDEQSLENIMTAISVKYGGEPPFQSGWLTSKQRTILVAQLTAFYTTLKVDQPTARAIAQLTHMDRSAKRKETFQNADTDPQDQRLSVDEIETFFRTRPTIRHQLFLTGSSDDALHDIQENEKATFSLLRYDSDADHFVTLKEFLFDDLSIRSLLLLELNKFLGSSSVIEWIEEHQRVAKICVSPNNCWFEGDATFNKKKKEQHQAGFPTAEDSEKDEEEEANDATKLRKLSAQVQAFYSKVVPSKIAAASATAQRWADDPRRLHAALIKRYFKESVHEWWEFLGVGKMKIESAEAASGEGQGGRGPGEAGGTNAPTIIYHTAFTESWMTGKLATSS